MMLLSTGSVRNRLQVFTSSRHSLERLRVAQRENMGTQTSFQTARPNVNKEASQWIACLLAERVADFT